MRKALELFCERRPDCSYGLSSMTPNAGYSFPRECPVCGGDLIKAANYNGPDP